jgi:hypothetical protein
MKAETKRRIKAAIERIDAALWVMVRRWAFRQLRKLVDVADDRLQAAQVKLRNELSDLSGRQHPALTVHSSEDMLHQRTDEQRSANARSESELLIPYETPNSYAKWEARKSGVAPVTKKSARRVRHRLTAAEFDRQFA